MDKFWLTYILVCIIDISFDILAVIVKLTNDKLVVMVVAMILILNIYFPMLLLTLKGEGIILGVEATIENMRLVYYPTIVSITCLFIAFIFIK